MRTGTWTLAASLMGEAFVSKPDGEKNAFSSGWRFFGVLRAMHLATKGDAGTTADRDAQLRALPRSHQKSENRRAEHL